MADKQGYLHVLWESRKETFAPYLQFCEQCVPPGVQEGYPFLFPYLKIVRIVAGACVWMLPRQQYALSAGDYILFNNLEPRALTEVSGDAPLFLEQAIILPTSFPTALLRTDFFYLCRTVCIRLCCIPIERGTRWWMRAIVPCPQRSDRR